MRVADRPTETVVIRESAAPRVAAGAGVELVSLDRRCEAQAPTGLRAHDPGSPARVFEPISDQVAHRVSDRLHLRRGADKGTIRLGSYFTSIAKAGPLP